MLPVPALAPPAALAEGEELVAGRRPVEEAFVARRAARRLLVVPHRRAALEKLVLHATNLRIPIVEVEGGSLTALAGFDGHQGVALVVEPRRFASIDDILARAAERHEAPFVLVLDSMEDPHNVGSLLRSAEAAGVHGVIFPTHRQAPLSPSAVKASAGAIEHLLLAPVEDLPGALSDLRTRGLRVAGADGSAPMTARQADLRGPLALVVGSEGKGLGSAVRRRADLFIRIPMRGVVGSLNAAVAGSILLFEALAQREPGDGDGGPTVASPTTTARSESVPAVDTGSATSDAQPSPPATPRRASRRKAAPETPAEDAAKATTDPLATESAALPAEDAAEAADRPAGPPVPPAESTPGAESLETPASTPSGPTEDEDALLPGDPTATKPPPAARKRVRRSPPTAPGDPHA